MALPTNLSTVTVNGTYKNFLGNAVAGQVRFSLNSTPLVDSAEDIIVVPVSVTVNLDTNGSFTVTLPATDDPDVYPTGTQYLVEESFIGGRSYYISLPAATSPVDISDIAPVPTLSPQYVGLVTEGLWNPLVANINALRAEVDPATGSFYLDGEYTFFQLAYASYTALNAAFATYTALNAGPYPVSGSAFAQFATDADNARIAAQASQATATATASSFLNNFLLIGG